MTSQSDMCYIHTDCINYNFIASIKSTSITIIMCITNNNSLHRPSIVWERVLTLPWNFSIGSLEFIPKNTSYNFLLYVTDMWLFLDIFL